VPPRVTLKEYLGPRHVCLHPTLDMLYSSDEQGSSTTAYAIDSSAGLLTPVQTITTLPADYKEQNSTFEVLITPSGLNSGWWDGGHENPISRPAIPTQDHKESDTQATSLLRRGFTLVSSAIATLRWSVNVKTSARKKAVIFTQKAM